MPENHSTTAVCPRSPRKPQLWTCWWVFLWPWLCADWLPPPSPPPAWPADRLTTPSLAPPADRPGLHAGPPLTRHAPCQNQSIHPSIFNTRFFLNSGVVENQNNPTFFSYYRNILFLDFFLIIFFFSALYCCCNCNWTQCGINKGILILILIHKQLLWFFFFIAGEIHKWTRLWCFNSYGSSGLCVALLCQPLNSLGMQISVRPLQNGLVLRALQTQSFHTRTAVSPQRVCNLLLLLPQTQLQLLAFLLADWQVPPGDRRRDETWTKRNSNQWPGRWPLFCCHANLREMTWPSNISIWAWCIALRCSWQETDTLCQFL